MLFDKSEWKGRMEMLEKIGRIVLTTCLCGFMSACTPRDALKGNQSDIRKAEIRKAYLKSTAQPSPVANAFLNISTTVLAVYAVGKIKNGPEIIQIMSNHRLRKLEIENRLPSTVSVTRHDE